MKAKQSNKTKKQTLLQWYRSLSAEDKEKCKRYWAKAKNIT
ncbi:hypothetical protein LCGC14_2053500 [marine sediment metagenome]|uniref:Uncharacterized protein n=1 Tax=marine sediment metagenome TaxID=412755 RepID=A0A0F9FAR0_9ZZZZ